MEVINITFLGETDEDEYIYDLETDNGTFLAGGFEGIIVSNTDSAFCMFNVIRSEYESDTEFMKENFRLAKECAGRITKTFKKPIDLEFEKVMMPFFLYAKKRYAYQEFLTPEKPTEELQFKGIQIVRRDNCQYVKEVCITLFDILMREKNQAKAIEYAKDSIDKLLNGDVPIEKLILSKSLKATYKNGEEQIPWTGEKIVGNKTEYVEINYPHVRLAQKLRQIDPMNSPKPPERIPFVYIVNKKKNTLQWERVAHPDYLENNKIDTLYYFDHQLKTPIDMIFDLLIDNPSILYSDKIMHKINKMNKQPEITNYFKRISQ